MEGDTICLSATEVGVTASRCYRLERNDGDTITRKPTTSVCESQRMSVSDRLLEGKEV